MKPHSISPAPKRASFCRAVAATLSFVSIAAITSSCTALRSGESTARRPVPLHWRKTFRVTENLSLPVGGLPDRTLGLMEQRGLAFFEHDEVATLALWLNYETTGTNTTYRGYAQYTFKDGSTIVALRERTGAAPGEQEGTLAFLQGTGRFLGINGKATFKAVTVTARTAGSDTYMDATGTYVLLRTIPPAAD